MLVDEEEYYGLKNTLLGAWRNVMLEDGVICIV